MKKLSWIVLLVLFGCSSSETWEADDCFLNYEYRWYDLRTTITIEESRVLYNMSQLDDITGQAYLTPQNYEIIEKEEIVENYWFYILKAENSNYYTAMIQHKYVGLNKERSQFVEPSVDPWLSLNVMLEWKEKAIRRLEEGKKYSYQGRFYDKL